MRARGVNAFIESYGSSAQSFQRHRASDIGDARKTFRAMKREPADGAHRLRAVQERQTFFDFQL